MLHSRLHAHRTPDKPAYIMAGSGRTVTYGQLETRANQCSHFFRDIGLNEKELIAYCLKHLSKIKYPKSIEFRETLPRTPTGKQLKRLLMEK